MTTKAKASQKHAPADDETSPAAPEQPDTIDDPVLTTDDAAPDPAAGERFTTAKVSPGVCVVNDGRCVGRAANGLVCSYHAMTYRADGVRRTP